MTTSVDHNSSSLSADRLYRLLSGAYISYARCLDDQCAEGWADFFDEDCLYVVTTADNYRNGFQAGLIYLDSKGMLADRIAALRTANIYERHSYRHIINPPSLTSCVGDEIHCETGFVVIRTMRTGEMIIFAAGRYVDHLRMVGDRLLIRSRIVVCDSSSTDTLLALPL